MSAGQVLADLVLAPRCAGCGDPGSWFCVGCRDLCDAVAVPGALPGRPKVDLARAARAANVRRAFLAEAGALRGLRVALVDDVATTGATLHDAASAARAAGARHVRAYVIGVDA